MIDIRSLWDYSNPELSERRFRRALETADTEDRLILLTQIARSYGLRRDFDTARTILAEVEANLPTANAETHTRYFLELGRSYTSAAHKKEQMTPETVELARAAFGNAFETASKNKLDDLAIDSLHMMPFVDTDPQLQLEWNKKAVEYMEKSDKPEAKRWEASLRNNLGYALHLKGDYDQALAQFELSRAAHENSGNAQNVRIADWMIAWTYRAQKRFSDALVLQLKIEKECAAAEEPDPYVFQELEILYKELGDSEKSAMYGKKFKESGGT